MASRAFTLFETAIGLCGIVWSANGICGVQLPEGDRDKTLARLKKRFPDALETAPPPHVQGVIADVVALLHGERRDFAAAPLDLDGISEFNRKVYDAAKKIPPGETMTYGELAAAIGEPGAARAVGKALGENPIPVIVPCHRILAADGRTGGFSAPGGVDTKLRILTIEGARTSDQPLLFDKLELTARRR
jgi:methylated-DNA-[protein]-cysteine S-methyltransferase